MGVAFVVTGVSVVSVVVVAGDALASLVSVASLERFFFLFAFFVMGAVAAAEDFFFFFPVFLGVRFLRGEKPAFLLRCLMNCWKSCTNVALCLWFLWTTECLMKVLVFIFSVSRRLANAVASEEAAAVSVLNSLTKVRTLSVYVWPANPIWKSGPHTGVVSPSAPVK